MTQTEWQEGILSHFPGVKKSGNGYSCQCPAHDDNSPSLSIKFVPNTEGMKASIKCMAGCEWANVLTAAHLKKQDVYFHTNGNSKSSQKFSSSQKPEKSEKPVSIDFEHPTKIYSYTDETGKELYQNCRYETDKLGNRLEKKTFRQRHSIGGAWAYSLNGCRRVPYNFHKLIVSLSVRITMSRAARKLRRKQNNIGGLARMS